LGAAVEAQRRFTADASHELRSPLTALRGELEVARRRERSKEEYARVLDSALDEVERLSRIAEDLLTLTRSETGAVALHRELVELVGRVSHTVGRLNRKAQEKGVAVTVEAPTPVQALVDPDLLDQVLWNLVDNAIKFTPEGGSVIVSVRQEEGFAALQVNDTGPGIPQNRLDHIFERFFRMDESRTPGAPEGGTGLGLSIVRAISELHGGRVEAGNNSQGGAQFRVYLPHMKESS